MRKKKNINDAVEILHRTFIKDRPDRISSLETERVNAEVAKILHDLRKDAGLNQKDSCIEFQSFRHNKEVTSTAEKHNDICSKCGDRLREDHAGQGFVRHETNPHCDSEKGERDKLPD